MQNFIINGVTFPSECYGKPLRKWDKEHQLLIVQARKNGASIRKIGQTLDLELTLLNIEVNRLLPQASNTSNVILKRHEEVLDSLEDIADELTVPLAMQLLDKPYNQASYILSLVFVRRYRKNNPNVSVLRSLKTSVKKVEVSKGSTLDKDDLNKLNHLAHLTSLIQKEIKTITDKYSN